MIPILKERSTLILWFAIGSLISHCCLSVGAFVLPQSVGNSVTKAVAIPPGNNVRARPPTHLHVDMENKLKKLAQKEVSDKQVEELRQSYAEQSRPFRRDLFTSSDWIRYRRSDRFLTYFLNIFDSGLVRALKLEISLLATVSTFVVLYNDLLVRGFDGNSQAFHLPPLELPSIPFTLSTAALGLLLTFRTNVSYSRWNEARTAWGAVINDSRSIVRMGCIWTNSYNGDHQEMDVRDNLLQRLGDAVCSFSRSLMNRTLPPQEDKERFLQYTHTQIQDQYYGHVLREAQHRPTAALAEITQILVDLQLNPIHQVEVEKCVTSLCNALGASERIFTSPVPTFYTRHTARFLTVWLFTLPLGLYPTFAESSLNNLSLIPVTVVLGVFLLGIEELATQMEEPFSILPMEKMCEGSIRKPITEQLQRSRSGSRFESDQPSTDETSLQQAVTASIPTTSAPRREQEISISQLSETNLSSSNTNIEEDEDGSSNNEWFQWQGSSADDTESTTGAFSRASTVEEDGVIPHGVCIDFATDGDMLCETTDGQGFYPTPTLGEPIEPNLDSELSASYSPGVSEQEVPPPTSLTNTQKPTSYMPTSSYKVSSGSGIQSYVDTMPSSIGSFAENLSPPLFDETQVSQTNHLDTQSQYSNNDSNYRSGSAGAGIGSFADSLSGHQDTSTRPQPSFMPTFKTPSSTFSSGTSYLDTMKTEFATESWNNVADTVDSSVNDETSVSRSNEPSASAQSYSYLDNLSSNPSVASTYNDYAIGHDDQAQEGDSIDGVTDTYSDRSFSNSNSMSHPPASFMPRSYKKTSGSGMPSYFDNF